MTLASTWLRALALCTLVTLNAGAAGAPVATEGPWRLRIDLSSFFDGPLGTVERVIELRDGRWEGDIREGQIYLGFRVAIADGSASGLMAVKAGSRFNAVSIPFHGVVAGGVVERRLAGSATMLGSGRKGTNTRIIDVHLRLERQ